jgi:Fe-S-cluster containining protein
VQADLALLCQSCGLCCDGSLFGFVALEGEELALTKHRLRVLPSGKGFEQPCSALTSSGPGPGGYVCSIYEERPIACRRFVCRLYDRHQREGGPIEDRLAVVRRVRFLVATLEGSGFTPADFEAAPSSARPCDESASAARRAYLELTRSLEEDFARSSDGPG